MKEGFNSVIRSHGLAVRITRQIQALLGVRLQTQTRQEGNTKNAEVLLLS